MNLYYYKQQNMQNVVTAARIIFLMDYMWITRRRATTTIKISERFIFQWFLSSLEYILPTIRDRLAEG